MEFNYEKLKNLRIHELRDLARTVGVKSPTSQKKDELIEQVMQIINGEAMPYVNITKHGRPPKSLQKIDDLADVLLSKPLSSVVYDTVADYNKYEVKSGDFFNLYANSPNLLYNDSIRYSGTNVASGYLNINKNGYGIVMVNGFTPSENDVFLYMHEIKKYTLKSGDYIMGKVAKPENNYPSIMLELLEINNISVGAYNINQQRTNFDDMEYLPIQNSIVLENNGISIVDFTNTHSLIKEGGTLLYLKSGKIDYNCIAQLSKAFNEEDFYIYFINLNAKPEEREQNTINYTNVNVLFNKGEAQQINTLNFVIEKAKRDIEIGKRVVIVINRLSAYIKAINYLENQGVKEGLTLDAVHNTKNIIATAKRAQNGGSITVIIMDTLLNEDSMKNFLQYELSDLFNNTVIIENCENKENFIIK